MCPYKKVTKRPSWEDNSKGSLGVTALLDKAGNNSVDISMVDPTTQRLRKELRFLKEGTEILRNDKRFSRKQVESKDCLMQMIGSHEATNAYSANIQ